MFKLEVKKKFVDDSEFKFPYGLPITSSDVAACAALELIGNEDQECVLAFFLDVKNTVVGYSEVARGSIEGCAVDMRVVLRSALVCPGICGVIIAHSHPSGCLEASRLDDALTKRLYCACELAGIHLLDHIIVGPTGHTYSYQAEGKMRQIALATVGIMENLMSGG